VLSRSLTHDGVNVHVTVQGTAFSAANLEISDALSSEQRIPNLGQKICMIDCCSESFPGILHSSGVLAQPWGSMTGQMSRTRDEEAEDRIVVGVKTEAQQRGRSSWPAWRGRSTWLIVLRSCTASGKKWSGFQKLRIAS
jgi:hypothetical protein